MVLWFCIFPNHLVRAFTFLALVLTAFFSLQTLVYAQRDAASIVNVQVSDSKETPIFQADVRLLTFAQGNSPFRSFTDGAGRVSFAGVRRGSYYLEVGKQGYESVRERVDVNPGGVDGRGVTT